MTDYIKREDAIERLKYHTDFYQNDREFGGEEMLYKDSALNEMSELPSADVRENVRGEWIRRDSRYVGWISFDCSVCGETLELDRETSNDFKYCPFCGAQMGGDNNV